MVYFKYGGKDAASCKLVDAGNLLVIRTYSEVDIRQIEVSETSREVVKHLIPVSSFPEANVTVCQVVSRDKDRLLQIRNLARTLLKKEKNIRFAGRVLKELKTGTVFIYTENLFVKFRDKADGKECEAVIKSYGLMIKELLGFARNAYFVQGQEGVGRTIFDLAAQMLDREDVDFCHPELVSEKKQKNIHVNQWHLAPTTIDGQFIDQHVNVEDAWRETKGEGVTIAVIDDGFDLDHPEFKVTGKIKAPRDTMLNLDDPRPKSSGERHGTACAGVACASGVDLATGVAPEAQLMPIRSGNLGSMSEAKAFMWAADAGADVISCSWGPPDGNWRYINDPLHNFFFPMPDSTRLAIDYAIEKGRDGKGCVITWASGNGNENVGFDGYASYPKVIAVGACNDRGTRSIYSDFGSELWCCFPSKDFYSPQLGHPRPLTVGIWTTDRSGKFGYNPGAPFRENAMDDPEGKYTASFGGTSSACPGVAGVAALIVSVNPALSWLEVREIIRNSCDQIDQASGNYDENGHSIFYGYGRINAGRAVANAEATLGVVERVAVKGWANFNKHEHVPISDGVFAGVFAQDNRFLGISLELEPFHPDLSIAYQVFVNKWAPSDGRNGAFAGTRDRRRKIIGIRLELEGPMKDLYSLNYAARFNGHEGQPGVAENGQVLGKSTGTGPAIEQIMVSLSRK